MRVFRNQGNSPSEGCTATTHRVSDCAAGLADKFILRQECQEFREPSAEAAKAGKTAEVVVKLTVDLRPLFQPIAPDGTTTWFELVDHVRIVKGESLVVADRLPLPVTVNFAATPPAADQNKIGQILIEPFIFTDVIPVEDAERGSVGRHLAGISYQLQIVPLGMSDASKEDLERLKLTQRFPIVRPFVPANRDFPNDLGLVFLIDGASTAVGTEMERAEAGTTVRLIHTTASADVASFPLAALRKGEFELWYGRGRFAPQRLLQPVAGGRRRRWERAGQAALRRESRISNAASNQELISTAGLLHLSDDWIREGASPGEFVLLTGRGSPLHEGVGYRFLIRPTGSTPLTPVRELAIFARRAAPLQQAAARKGFASIRAATGTRSSVREPVAVLLAASQGADRGFRGRSAASPLGELDPCQRSAGGRGGNPRPRRAGEEDAVHTPR